MPEDAVVEAPRRGGAARGAEAEVVFDGRAPAGGIPTADESADDWIARRGAELSAAGEPYWLVTSDRELRERARGSAQRVIGGGGVGRQPQAPRSSRGGWQTGAP